MSTRDLQRSSDFLQTQVSEKIFGGDYLNNANYIESREQSKSHLKKATKKIDISKLNEAQSLALLQMMRSGIEKG